MIDADPETVQNAGIFTLLWINNTEQICRYTSTVERRVAYPNNDSELFGKTATFLSKSGNFPPKAHYYLIHLIVTTKFCQLEMMFRPNPDLAILNGKSVQKKDLDPSVRMVSCEWHLQRHKFNNGLRLTFGGNSQWYFWPNLFTIVMAPPGAW
jgi:hypothetical protein